VAVPYSSVHCKGGRVDKDDVWYRVFHINICARFVATPLAVIVKCALSPEHLPAPNAPSAATGQQLPRNP
jgi:hypothetical protein